MVRLSALCEEYSPYNYGPDLLEAIRALSDRVYFVGTEILLRTADHEINISSRFLREQDFMAGAADCVLDCLENNSYFDYLSRQEKREMSESVRASKDFFYEQSFSYAGFGSVAVSVGAYDFTRLAQVAQGSFSQNPTRDSFGNEILTRDELLLECRGGYVDSTFHYNMSCEPAKIVQVANDTQLEQILFSGGKIYDAYVQIPLGSLMVTKDSVFPHIFGRKKFQDLRCKKEPFCRYSEQIGLRIATVDPCVHLIGVDTQIFRSPVFCSRFDFPMDVTSGTIVVPKSDELHCIEEAVNSSGVFDRIWVQNMPQALAQELGVTIEGRDWSPTKDQLFRAICKQLEI